MEGDYPIEMMMQDPVDISESQKRLPGQQGEEEQLPESKRTRTIGGLAVSFTPIAVCVVNVELDAYSAEPVREQNLDNVRGTLSHVPLPAHKVREGRARERL